MPEEGAPPEGALAALVSREEGKYAREYLALLLLQQGASLPEVALYLPNHFRLARGVYGVSAGLTRELVLAGLRALASHIKRGHRPPGVPAELWPPFEVQEAVRAESKNRGNRGRFSTRALRAWIENSGGQTASRA